MRNIIELRKKKLKNGGYSLYLDMYRNGERSYEFLHMYLVPPKTPLDKKQNNVTLEAAKTIQSQRIIEVQRGEANILYTNKGMTCKDFFKSYMETRRISKSRRYGTINAWKEWCSVISQDRRIGSITPADARKFLKHLSEKDLCENSQHEYYSVISTILNSAVRKNALTKNPFSSLDRSEKPKRERRDNLKYLTKDEVKALISTPCSIPEAKSAFLLSCFTGLRISDIKCLTWDMIHGNQIEKTQIKTHESVYVPLSKNALKYIPKKKPAEMKGEIFPIVAHSRMADQYKALKDWGKAAGISKNVTYHMARHTCATLLLSYGADIYTISKILGHSNVNVTQVYAHVLNKDKMKAVNLVPKF